MALQLAEPWYVANVSFKEVTQGKQELHIDIGFEKGYSFGSGAKVHDTLERTWRHLNFNLETYIRKYHLSDDTGRYLFYSNNKGPNCKLSQETIRKQLSKYAETAHQICEEVPLDFHSHQFRHSMAVHRLEDGMNIVQLSKELGHASVETTMIYLDVVPGKRERAIAELESEEIKNSQENGSHKYKNSKTFLNVIDKDNSNKIRIKTLCSCLLSLYVGIIFELV